MRMPFPSPLLFTLFLLAHNFLPLAAQLNPYQGKTLYLPNAYNKNLSATLSSFLSKGDTLNAARVRTVQKRGSTFVWLRRSSDISYLTSELDQAVTKHARDPDGSVLFQIAIHNIPDQTCNGRYSGEFHFSDSGAEKYKRFIDTIAEAISKPKYARKLSYSIILEPNALKTLVVNINLAGCSQVLNPQREVLAYAIDRLQSERTSLYLEVGSSGWLGWETSVNVTAALIGGLLYNTKPASKLRGLATNVADFYPLTASARGPEYDPSSDYWSEFSLVRALARDLATLNYRPSFIIDTSRNGRSGLKRPAGLDACNLDGAGFGRLPEVLTGADVPAMLDAVVWVKEAGVSDGTSDPNDQTYKSQCYVGYGAKGPAPKEGEWFEEYVEMLVKNANPPLEPDNP